MGSYWGGGLHFLGSLRGSGYNYHHHFGTEPFEDAVPLQGTRQGLGPAVGDSEFRELGGLGFIRTAGRIKKLDPPNYTNP